MEKAQFVNFIATILEESGFKVFRDFKSFQHVIDIYAVLPSIMGDFTIAIACKNYDEEWKVGLDIIKEMEMVGRVLKVSKIVIATTSSFSPQGRNYASEKKIKLLDRDNLIILAKKFSKKHPSLEEEKNSYHPSRNHDNFEREKSSYNSLRNHDPPGEKNSYTLPKTYDPLEEEKNSYEENEPFKEDYGHYSKTSLKTEYYREHHGKQEGNGNKVSLKKAGNIPSKVNNNSRPRSSRLKASERSDISSSNLKSSSGILDREKIKVPEEPLSTKIKRIMNSPVVLIILVVSISYLIAFIFYLIAKVPVGIQGLIKILSSLILSFGLVFAVNRKGTAVLLKGSIVFFISLIIIILMIILL